MQHKAFFVFCDIHLHYLNYYAFIIILLQSYSRLELVLLAVSFWKTLPSLGSVQEKEDKSL